MDINTIHVVFLLIILYIAIHVVSDPANNFEENSENYIIILIISVAVLLILMIFNNQIIKEKERFVNTCKLIPLDVINNAIIRQSHQDFTKNHYVSCCVRKNRKSK
jgi:low affinity Fe/Cu permease